MSTVKLHTRALRNGKDFFFLLIMEPERHPCNAIYWQVQQPAFIIPSGSDIGLHGCGIGNIFKSIILPKFNLIKGLRSNCSAPYQGIGTYKD